MQIAYNREKFTTVNVYGIGCDFSDIRMVWEGCENAGIEFNYERFIRDRI